MSEPLSTTVRPARRRPTRERTIEQHLLEQCRAHGVLCLKFVSPARSGVPDRLLVHPNGVVFVELKRPGEKATKLQRTVHAKLRRFGAEVHVIDSSEGLDALVADLVTRDSHHGVTSVAPHDPPHAA